MRFKKLAISALVIGFASLGVMPANAVTPAITAPSCPAGATMLPSGNCEVPGEIINRGQTVPYEMCPIVGGSTGCFTDGWNFNQDNWPAWYGWKLTESTVVPPTQPTQTGCPALNIRKGGDCYTMTEYASVGSLGSFGTVIDWAKTYILPAIIGLVLIGIGLKLGIGASKKYLSNLKG